MSRIKERIDNIRVERILKSFLLRKLKLKPFLAQCLGDLMSI